MKSELKSRLEAAGFGHSAITAIAPPSRARYFLQWIQDGLHGTMAWMARDPHRRIDPAAILPGAKSIVFAALNYYQPQPERRAKIATYSLGLDYHDIILDKLNPIDQWLREQGGTQKIVVDTAPLLEKNLAQTAGLGWQGKSTMLIHPKLGTWYFIASILTTLELPPDAPTEDHCGTCTRCIAACPTQAITSPYKLDARRCIAYLTIEHKGSIPLEYRKAIGDRVYGCDDCLKVCPWNRWAQKTREAAFTPVVLPDLPEMLSWDDATFRSVFKGSPIKRIKLPNWQRNICVVLGNGGTPDDLPALRQFSSSAEPWLAEHAEWAIREISARYDLTVY